jgi:tetratricopeptide (TPR) repeat protein
VIGRLLAIALLVCAVFPSFCRAAEGTPEAQLNRGVRNSDACAYHLMSEAGMNKPEARGLLEKAVACAPDLPAAYLALSRASFSFSGQGILKSIDYLIQGVTAYFRNFWWSFSLAASLFFSLVFSFIVAVALVIITRLASDVPLLTHDISESRSRAVLLLVLLLTAFAGPLVLIGGLLVLLSVYMSKPDRFLVYLYLLFLLCSPLIFQTASEFVDAYSSGSLKAVVQANGFQGNRYALSVLDGDDDYDALFTYALALKREGRYEDAIALNEKLLKERPDARVYVNLGNCYVGLYNFQESRKSYLGKAFGYYTKALDVRPVASAYYNMSQVSREQLDFTSGNSYYKSAIALDRDTVALYSMNSSRNPNRFTADETLPAPALWKYIRTRYGKTSALGMTPAPVMFLPFFSLLLLGEYYLLNTLLRDKAYRCRKCSTILCAKCEKSLAWGQMCPDCYASLVKLDELDVKERVSRLLTIYDHGRNRRNTMKVLSFTLPGLSQVYAGRILSGFAFLWPFLFFVSLPLTQSVFSPGGLSGVGFFSMLGISLAAVLWAAAQFITRQRISRGWL